MKIKMGATPVFIFMWYTGRGVWGRNVSTKMKIKMGATPCFYFGHKIDSHVG